MASPLGHSLAGIALGRMFGVGGGTPSLKWYVFAAFAANAADLDFLPGLLIGNINRFHQGPTHSFAAALFFGGLVAIVVRRGSSSAIRVGMAGGLFYASHLLLDFFGHDIRSPFGIPLFWPLLSAHFISAWPIFRGVKHGVPGEDFSTFWGHLFSYENLLTLGLEALVLSPIVLLCWVACRRTERIEGIGGGEEISTDRSIDSREGHTNLNQNVEERHE